MLDRFFAYGSLRPGERHHDVIAPYVVVARPATAAGTVRQEEYPLADFGADGEIAGTVFELRAIERALIQLDAFEGDGYRRVVIEVTTECGTEQAWAYEAR